MKTAVVLNALIDGLYWTKSINGADPIQEVLKKAALLASKDGIFVLVEKSEIGRLGKRLHGCNLIKVENMAVREVFSLVHEHCRRYSNLIYWYADAPLIDVDLAHKMLLLHRDGLAEYTHGEGFPGGVVPEIVRVGLLPKLGALLRVDDGEIGRASIFNTLAKQINSFDIETYFSPEDMRLSRIELFTTSRRTALLVQRIVEKEGFGCGFEDIRRIIHEQPELLRTVPSYVEVEITTENACNCIYSPLPSLTRPLGSMEYGQFKGVIDRVLDFTGGFHLAFALYGEPLIHREIHKLVEYALSRPEVELVIETDGALWSPTFSDYVHGLAAKNLHIIFELDAATEKTYTRIRESDLNMVERNIRYLLDKGTQNVYVQMVRMDQNEDEMLDFFKVWDREAGGAIIQKYNSYLGVLPALSTADLRPLERGSCWHLLRDLVIFWDGRVPRCRQDINGRFILGNILSEQLSDIWEKGATFWLQHCEKKYDEDCRRCDEWFTFNF
jgi:spiro-SPASM protein